MGKLATAWGAEGGLVSANGTVVLLGGANSTNDVPGGAGSSMWRAERSCSLALRLQVVTPAGTEPGCGGMPHACHTQTALLHCCTPAEDPEITQQLNDLRGGLNDLNSQVIGSSLVFLNGERVDVRNNETNLGAARVGVMARGA